MVDAVTPWYPASKTPKNAKIISIADEFPNSRLPYWGYNVDLALVAPPASTLGQLVRMSEGRLRVIVACGGAAVILPWTALAILFIGFYSRVLRSNVLDTINEDFVRTAKSKGLSSRRIMRKHVLRTARQAVDQVLAGHRSVKSVDAYSFLGRTNPDDPPNEHVFYDLNVAKSVASSIADRMAAIDPANAADY